MKLRKLITEEEYAALGEATQALYGEKGADGKYRLDIEDDDYSELKRSKDHEKEARQAAEAKARELETRLSEMQRNQQDEDDRKKKNDKDFEGLEASYNERVAQLEERHQQQLDTLRNAYTRDVVDASAMQLAKDISTSPDLLLPHVRGRFTVDFDGEDPRVLIKGNQEGTFSNIDELRNELVNDARFSPIITGTKSSGGGAAGDQGGGAAGKKFSEMSVKEKTELKNTDPDRYSREIENQNAAGGLRL